MEKIVELSGDFIAEKFKDSLMVFIESIVRESNEMGLNNEFIIDVVFEENETGGMDIFLEYDNADNLKDEDTNGRV
jgi:hypothetical protein